MPVSVWKTVTIQTLVKDLITQMLTREVAPVVICKTKVCLKYSASTNVETKLVTGDV